MTHKSGTNHIHVNKPTCMLWTYYNGLCSLQGHPLKSRRTNRWMDGQKFSYSCLVAAKKENINILLGCTSHTFQIYSYVCQLTVPSLNRVMASQPFGTKPLPKQMLNYCQLNPSLGNKQNVLTWESKYNNFHSDKYIWNIIYAKYQPLFSGLNILIK